MCYTVACHLDLPWRHGNAKGYRLAPRHISQVSAGSVPTTPSLIEPSSGMSKIEFFKMLRNRINIIVVALFVSLVLIYERQRIFDALNVDSQPDVIPTPAPPPKTHVPVTPTFANNETVPLDNLLRTETQCKEDFPDLYDSIDRSVAHYQNQPLQRAHLDKAFDGAAGSFTWVVIRNNQLYVRSRHGGFQSRVAAVLADLHRAIITSPERLPDIEFLFNTADSAPSEEYTPVLGLCRGLDERAFLISDFGYWAWPEPFVNGYREFENQVARVEGEVPWNEKKDQLFWRGNVDMNPERQHLVTLSDQNNETWGNVRHIDWGHLKEDDRYDMADHCRFKFVAHIEGARYSARLKYLQHCNSVIVTHEQKWTTPLSHLLKTKGAEQNVVVVGSDFTKVGKVMDDLLSNKEKAARIARNNQETFGRRYARVGAETCYWRQLIRGYHSVMTPEFRESVTTKGAKDYESVMLMGKTEWGP
jgi:hypothetical protein